MDPVTVPRSRGGVSKPKLAALAVVLAIGAYLGGGLASGLNQGGLGSIVVLLTGVIVGTILAVMAVVAAILALSRDESGHRAARSIFIAGIVFVAGVGVGWAVEPAFRPEYRESVILEAPGTLNVSIDGLDGYMSHGDAPTKCHSEPDAEGIAGIGGDVVGSVGTAIVGASLTVLAGTPDGRPVVHLWIRPSVEDKGSAPFWEGSADVVEPVDGDSGGRIEFTRATFTEPDKAPPDGYPAELSGTLGWSCANWLLPSGPVATPR
jgi:hypothetical protein